MNSLREKTCLHGGGLKLVANKPFVDDFHDFTATLYGHEKSFIREVAIDFDGDSFRVRPQDHLLEAQLDEFEAYQRLADQETDTRDVQIRALAEAIANTPRPAWPQKAQRLPSIFVYFGQFLAHELSRLYVFENGKFENMNSASLDLDTIFWDKINKPQNLAHLYQSVDALEENDVAVGQTSYAGHNRRHHDLPRKHTGFPLTPDCRSDANVFVAQIQVAIHRHFINLVRRGVDNPTESLMDSIHNITLHDFLKRIVDEATWNDVMTHGRRMVSPGTGPPSGYLLPIEFAAGAFRFGHTMIRDEYKWSMASSTPKDVSRILVNTYNGGGLVQLEGKEVIRHDWQAEWSDSDSPSSANVAEPISPAISDSLKWLGQEHVPGATGPSNLALLTLQRGQTVELPSAQTLWREFSGELDGKCLSCCEILADQTSIIAAALADGQPGERLCCRTPLWFYTLREAQFYHGGTRLGPLAGRIVMESIHAAICFARKDIAPKDNGFSLADLLNDSKELENKRKQHPVSNHHREENENDVNRNIRRRRGH